VPGLRRVAPPWGLRPRAAGALNAALALAVVSDTPEQTKDALERAGVETLAAFSFVPGSEEGMSVEPRMTALLEAGSEDAAVSSVREVVGDDCDIQPA
jgi:hypothetical protein